LAEIIKILQRTKSLANLAQRCNIVTWRYINKNFSKGKNMTLHASQLLKQ